MRPIGVGEAGKDEQAVRIAVKDIEAPVLEPRLGPQQEVPALAGDSVRDGGIVETAGGGAEDAVERVHEDLDSLGGDVVVSALRHFAGLGQAVEHPREDRLASAKGGAGRGADHVFSGTSARNERERVDIERTHHARVQALEVEHPDVPVQSGDRLEDMAAGLGGRDARVSRTHGGRHDVALVEFRQVDEVE